MPKSVTEWIFAAVFGILMYQHSGWSTAARWTSSVVGSALAYTTTPAAAKSPQHPYARAIGAAMERRASERRRGY